MNEFTPDRAVASEGEYALMQLPDRGLNWPSGVIAIHKCNSTSQDPVFVSNPIDEECHFCGQIAPDKIQTLFVLFNGHY